MFRCVKYCAGFFAVIIVYVTYTYSHVFLCAMVEYSDLTEVENNLYAEKVNADSVRVRLLIDQARSRIINKFGEISSNPVIIFVSDFESSQRYGLSHGAVRSYITPWGSYIVVSSNIKNINILAHEYFHVEISERLGYLVKKIKLPVWLDEGLAMQVDYRERYKPGKHPIDSSEIDRVKKLNWSYEFWTDNNKQNIKNVRAAKAAVDEILNENSNERLYDLFLRIKEGEDIADVFDIKHR